MIVVGFMMGSAGCGGSVAKTDPGGPAAGTSTNDPNAGGAGSAGPGQAGMAAAGGSAGARTSEPLDAPDGSYPAVPPGSGAFFWKWGLGNWFVDRADGVHHDAGFEVLDAEKVWETKSEPGVAADLWAQLEHPSGRAIDLSAYSGISFDARGVGGSASLVVTFNANGDFKTADSASAAQRFALTTTWQTFQLSFADAGSGTGIASVDFIFSAPDAAVELQLRQLALRCTAICP